MKQALRLFTVLLSFAVALSACGGGGGGGGADPGTGQGTGSGLVVASKVSVVSAQTSTASGKPGLLKGLLMGVFQVALPAESDYSKDKTNVWVAERTSEAFDTINDILCMIGQTKYDVKVNTGPYTALVDEGLCGSSNADPSAAGQAGQNQSSGANMPSYMKFTVDSYRADNASPQIVKVWIHEPASEHNEAKLIYGKITITEGASETNPYGLFKMDFAGYLIDENGTAVGTPKFSGTLRAYRNDSGKVLLDFVSSDSYFDCGGTQTGLQAVTLDRAPDGSVGAGLIYEERDGTCGTGSRNLTFAYNPADFWRRDVDTLDSACLSRTKFSESSWSYGLYYAEDTTVFSALTGTVLRTAGSRVTRNSGFPITFGPSGQYRGWVGYWGLWKDNNAPELQNNDTVTRFDYKTNTSTEYGIFKAGGKLKKHTRKLLTLADIKNIPLGYWEQVASSPTGTNYQVVWDGSDFLKTDAMPQNCGGNCTWSKLAAPEPIDLSRLNWSNLNFWSQSLGGNAQVQLGTQASPCMYVVVEGGPGYTDCSSVPPTDATEVVFYKEDLVYPGDSSVPATLACYDNCLKAGASGVDPNNQFYNTWDPNTGMNSQVTYSFNAASLLLMDGVNSVVTTTTGGMNQWGSMTGALFEPSSANLDLLKCDWNTSQVCGWKAWSNLNVFYTWETGPNNWNQFIGLKNSDNSFVNFEAPLQVKYVHNQADSAMPDFAYNGSTFMLDYGGFGQLNGIPSFCVNMDTGDKVDCSQSDGSNAIRWVPQFTIPRVQADLSLTSVVDSNDVLYYVKPLEVEQRMMQDTAPGACDALAGSDFTGYVVPNMSIWSDPKASEPSVSGAPAVIGGEVQ